MPEHGPDDWSEIPPPPGSQPLPPGSQPLPYQLPQGPPGSQPLPPLYQQPYQQQPGSQPLPPLYQQPYQQQPGPPGTSSLPPLYQQPQQQGYDPLPPPQPLPPLHYPVAQPGPPGTSSLQPFQQQPAQQMPPQRQPGAGAVGGIPGRLTLTNNEQIYGYVRGDSELGREIISFDPLLSDGTLGPRRFYGPSAILSFETGSAETIMELLVYQSDPPRTLEDEVSVMRGLPILQEMLRRAGCWQEGEGYRITYSEGKVGVRHRPGSSPTRDSEVIAAVVRRLDTSPSRLSSSLWNEALKYGRRERGQ